MDYRFARQIEIKTVLDDAARVVERLGVGAIPGAQCIPALMIRCG
jgi:hypothetical protein